MPEEPPPSLWRGMWKRFLLGGMLIIVLSCATTAVVALNTVSGIAHEVFQKFNEIKAPKGVVTPVYSGGPQTFLVLGSDRRAKSRDQFDRTDPPHSDTMLLVRLDPEQGQTSVLSIPRDLLVNITTENGQYYPNQKINAAYTIGSQMGGHDGGARLAAETIEHQVFPHLKLNGIIDVTFKGFIEVVDSLGCVYVNVDHRYYNPEGTGYSAINLQPGYQKLCYEHALSYVRYRHTDSDFVRVARQQDFIRDLREQISSGNVIGQIEAIAKAVGHAISSSFKPSASVLIELAKLIAFSQNKPLRQVKFKTSNVNAQIGGGSYVTTSTKDAEETLSDFLNGDQKVHISSSTLPGHKSSHGHHHSSHASSPAAIGLYPTSSVGYNEAVNAAVSIPFHVLYPSLQTGPAVQQTVRPYTLRDQQENLHHAYVIVFEQSPLGGYYDLEGTDWLDPPIIAHPDETRHIGGTTYMISSDGEHIHMIAWRRGKVLYWLTNTLLEELTNAQMLAIARAAHSLH